MVLGQDHILSALREACAAGRLHHAYLLAGTLGLGQTETALWLAQMANCESEGPQPCGVCSACHLIAAHNHPDVTWVIPSEKSKTRKITIEQIQEVRTEAARRPVLGRRKLLIITVADNLTLEAANCLLKTLEEPPDYVTLVLIASDTTNVPATVLSRCQVQRFLPVDRDAISAWLREQGADGTTATRLAGLCDGCPEEALRLWKTPEALAARDATLDLMEEASRCSLRDALWIASVLREKPSGETGDLQNRLYWAGSWFRDLLAIRCGADMERIVNQDRIRSLSDAADLYAPDRIVKALDAIIRTRRYLAGNANLSLSTDALALCLVPKGNDQ